MRGLLRALLLALLLNVFAAGSAAAKDPVVPARPAAVTSVAKCPTGEIAGCNKGIWSLNSSGFAVIAMLDEPATYKICVKSGSKGPVRVAVDQAVIHVNGNYPTIYPAATADEVFNSACALVFGKLIHLEAVDTLSNPLPAFGEYERVEEVNPLKHLFSFNLQMEPNKDHSAFLATGEKRALYRVCLGPLTPAAGLGEGRRHIYTDKGFILPANGAPRGFPFSNHTCIDLHAKQVFLFSPLPAANERVSGFVAYSY